jgi:hypothetical protein
VQKSKRKEKLLEQNGTPVLTADTLTLSPHKNFIAIDGESIDNKYVLLGTSHPHYCLENKEGISTDEALEFLFSLGHNRHNRAAHTSYVGFYFSYDVEMICRDLPLKTKRRLFQPRMILTKQGTLKKDRVYYKKWELTYIKRKFFSIKRKGAAHGITIYDTSGFFTGFPDRSFIGVLNQMRIPVPQEITEGKKARGQFTWHNYPVIKEYNRIECELLVRMMHEIYKMTESQNLTPRRWYGSSAVGNLALRKWGIRDYMRRTVEENMSGYFWDAITRGYFGGRIEAFKLGSFQEVESYDINSAYPAAIALLPCTRDNHFIYTQRYRKGFGIWRVRFKFPKEIYIGVLPFRLADGSIKFPLSGEGWYWNPEIELALKHWSKYVDVVEGYYLQDNKKPTPLQKLFPQLYETRKKLKAKGDLQHYIIKIVLNSIYGKFAQKVGRADFKNFTWAGWITSYTRAALRAAVINQEHDIIAFSTDGIYSLAPLKLKLSDKLGGWEHSFYERGTILMSGVYLLEGEQKKTGERGYAALSDWQGILEQLNEKRPKDRKQGSAEVIVRLFGGFNMADNFPNEYGEHYLKFVEKIKILSPHNLTKRKYRTRLINNWTTDNCDSEPINKLTGMSNPIKTKVDLTEEDDLIFTEDGNELAFMIREG